MRRAVLVILAACGGDGDAEPVLLTGSPAATRALAFTTDGTPVAIGGTSAFGLAHLQRQTGETWSRAAGIAGFGARAQLLGGGPLPLYAVSESSLYRLDDPATFSWSAIAIPLGASTGSLFGVDAAGLVYALDLADGLETDAIVVWNPDEVRWRDVPGTRPLGAGAASFTISASGRPAWALPAVGVRSVEAGAQITLLECPDCALSGLAFDRDETLTALACPFAVIRTGGTDAPLPTDQLACHGVSTSPDGTSLFTGDSGLFLLGATSSAWQRVAASLPGFRYVLRDREVAFAFGDGTGARGIYQLEL